MKITLTFFRDRAYTWRCTASDLIAEDHGFWLSNVHGRWEPDDKTWKFGYWNDAINKAWQNIISDIILGNNLGGPGGGPGLWTRIEVELL
jgi:hypothetical protein